MIEYQVKMYNGFMGENVAKIIDRKKIKQFSID